MQIDFSVMRTLAVKPSTMPYLEHGRDESQKLEMSCHWRISQMYIDQYSISSNKRIVMSHLADIPDVPNWDSTRENQSYL
jgi:hypothetical protein